MIEDDKWAKARYDLEQKIIKENQKRLVLERDVKMMENMELDLIHKL